MFTVDLYNSRNAATGMRGVAVDFRRAGASLLRVLPRDFDAVSVQAAMRHYPDFDVINLAPKQWVRLKLIGFLQPDEIAKMHTADSVDIVMIDPAGTEHRHHVRRRPIFHLAAAGPRPSPRPPRRPS